MSSIFKFILILLFLPTFATAKTKIYLVENTAVVSLVPQVESAFDLKISLNLQDNFSNWKICFFMLRVFSDQTGKYNSMICKDEICTPLILDVVHQLPVANIQDYLHPELTLGHVSVFRPASPFKLGTDNTTSTESSTYVIYIKGLKNPPKNITAMPQNLFLVSTNHPGIIPIHVTKYNGYDTGASQLQESARNSFKWYALPSPATIDSIVVPYPVHTSYTNGNYKLNSNINVHYCRNSESVLLCRGIKDQPEGYVLQIISSGVIIYTNTSAGIFYARQTLSQLANYYANNIPNQIITDYPRFRYRGIMLDTVRHFFTVNEIKQLLDIMATHKLNVLHLHLADDEGWRLQLPHYPKLAVIGSKRVFQGTIGPSNLIDGKFDISNFSDIEYAKADTLYTGSYSELDIRELIKYANARQITLIPEIEMPSHARVLKKTMPEIFFDANDKSVYSSVQGYNDSVLPVCKYGQDKQFTITVNGIIMDIAALFAGQSTLNYVKNEVSLSGDEVPTKGFTAYPMCNSGVYKGIDPGSIAYEFFKQLSISLPGYKLSGWQQLVQDDNGSIYSNALSPSVSGHIWEWEPTNKRPVSGLTMAAALSRAGYPTVLAFANLSYLDMRYSTRWEEPGLYWAAGATDTFSALISGLSTDHISNTTNVLGIEGVLWTELIPSSEHLFYMVVPKMAGIAEAGWSAKQDLSWRSLAVRLGCGQNGFLSFLAKTYNIHYRGYPQGIKLEVPPGKLCN